jgi:hypothetical protein
MKEERDERSLGRPTLRIVHYFGGASIRPALKKNATRHLQAASSTAALNMERADEKLDFFGISEDAAALRHGREGVVPSSGQRSVPPLVRHGRAVS